MIVNYSNLTSKIKIWLCHQKVSFFFSLSRSDKEDLFFLLFVCFYVIFFKKVLAFESFRFLKNVDDQEGFGARC